MESDNARLLSRVYSIGERWRAFLERPDKLKSSERGYEFETPVSAALRADAARLGALYFTTGRFCAGPACDPLAEGTFGGSDVARAGDGVAFFFAFSKALSWMLAVASVFAVPMCAINAGGALQGGRCEWALLPLGAGEGEELETSTGG